MSSVGRFNWTVTGPLNWYGIVNITYLTIILLFTLLNILVLWILQKTPHLRTSSNQLVSTMLLANILRSLTTVCMEIAEISSRFTIQNTAYCTLKVLLNLFAYNFVMVLTVEIALLRAYTCLKMTMVKLKQRTIIIILVIGGFIAGLITFPNLLPFSGTQQVCMVNFSKTRSSFQHNFTWIRVSLILLLFILIFISYSSMAYFIKIKRRSLNVGKNDVFSIKIGIQMSCLFAFTYSAPYIWIMLPVLEITKNLSELAFFNIIHFFINLTYLDIIVMPLMFITQSTKLRRQIRIFPADRSDTVG